MPRTVAIGDIHGCSIALARLLDAIDPQPDDTIITLGDYVDRGTDSRGVLNQLIELETKCRLIPLLGNHEEMLLGAKEGRSDLQFFLACGGDATLRSYGASGKLDLIPREHFAFLERCRLFYIAPRHFFVHANYRSEKMLGEQDRQTLLWLSLRGYVPGPHCSGRTAIVGHTPQPEVLNVGHLICIDTGCCMGGWLTALDVSSGQVWQVDERGQAREGT